MTRVRLKTNVLKEYIARRNITQADFAEEVGLHESQLSFLLSEARPPMPAIRQRLQDATGLTFDELFVIEESE